MRAAGPAQELAKMMLATFEASIGTTGEWAIAERGSATVPAGLTARAQSARPVDQQTLQSPTD